MTPNRTRLTSIKTGFDPHTDRKTPIGLRVHMDIRPGMVQCTDRSGIPPTLSRQPGLEHAERPPIDAHRLPVSDRSSDGTGSRYQVRNGR